MKHWLGRTPRTVGDWLGLALGTALIFGGVAQLPALAAAFLNAFWPLYRAGPRSGYLDEYRRRQALTGQRVLVTPRRGTPRAAQVQGIDDECKLVVRFDGESRPAALNSGEVSVRLL